MNKTHRTTPSTDSGYTSSGTSPTSGAGANAVVDPTTTSRTDNATHGTTAATGTGIGRDTSARGATNATTASTTSPRTSGTALASMASRGRGAEAARAGVGAAAGDRDHDHLATKSTGGVGRELRDNVGGTGPTGGGRATEDGYEPVTHIGGQRPGGSYFFLT